jgi:hypothetical protein
MKKNDIKIRSAFSVRQDIYKKRKKFLEDNRGELNRVRNKINVLIDEGVDNGASQVFYDEWNKIDTAIREVIQEEIKEAGYVYKVINGFVLEKAQCLYIQIF